MDITGCGLSKIVGLGVNYSFLRDVVRLVQSDRLELIEMEGLLIGPRK
jgi:hypothetical protein